MLRSNVLEAPPASCSVAQADARFVNSKGSTAKQSAIRRRELDEGDFKFRDTDEDIHTAIERRLTEITAAGASLHAGRSRNDQVALDLRLYCRFAASHLVAAVAEVIDVLASKARTHSGWVMLGYTLLQRW